ncbi:tripartite tricarboxylate transporter permease [Pseudoduganella lutea]|uniref:tripartite tricarboxylate transporter permease n=1 Tax=Pseudoduganella lutea TaxID=321985 RepID=UPI003531656F
MLMLGIPSNPVMALTIGATIIQGIQLGPAVMTEQPELFRGHHRIDVDREFFPDRPE